MSEYILVQIAKEHLPYEIDMLRGTFQLLKEIDATGGVAETDLAKQLFRNAFIESFCVHARSLLDFFSNRRIAPTDAIAGDFAAFTTSLKPMEEPLKTIRTKLNKEIFHLTKNRTITKKFDVGIDGVEILKMIKSEIEQFRAGLSAEYQPFECKIAPVEIAGLKFQTSTASTTNHISILSEPPV